MNITWADAFGFLAYASNVIGNLMLTGQSERGWWVRLGSITLWGIYSVYLMNPPMILNAVTFFGINCLGIYRWRKRDRQATP